MLINYISTKEVIGRFLKEFAIDDTTYIDDFPQWIEDAIDIMGITNYYITKFQFQKVTNSRAKLPCDIENLYSVGVSNTIVDKPTSNNIRKLTIRNSHAINNDFKLPELVGEFGTVNGRYLHTSFDYGYVFYGYSGIPTDCDGYPLVPKDTKVIHAIQYYFIYRMALSGYIHPVINHVDAYKMWEKTYPAASNSVNWPDLQDYQEFTAMWTDVFRQDLNTNYYIV